LQWTLRHSSDQEKALDVWLGSEGHARAAARPVQDAQAVDLRGGTSVDAFLNRGSCQPASSAARLIRTVLPCTSCVDAVIPGASMDCRGTNVAMFVITFLIYRASLEMLWITEVCSRFADIGTPCWGSGILRLNKPERRKATKACRWLATSSIRACTVCV
jgi:hypothetical protein